MCWIDTLTKVAMHDRDRGDRLSGAPGLLAEGRRDGVVGLPGLAGDVA